MERGPSRRPRYKTVEAEHSPEGLRVKGRSYSLLFRDDKPYIELQDKVGTEWAQLFTGSEVSTLKGEMAIHTFAPPEYYADDDVQCVRQQMYSGVHNELVQEWRFYDDYFETQLSFTPDAPLKDIRFFGGTYVRPNMFGDSMSLHDFKSVFNPQSSEMERRAIPATETTEITTSGMWQPGRRREFLICPFVYGFSRNRLRGNNAIPPGPWLMAGISAPIEQQNHTRFTYDAHEDGFSLRLDYDGYLPPSGESFTTPVMRLHFAETPMEGLSTYRALAIQRGELHDATLPIQPAWHSGVTYCSWGDQLEAQLHSEQIGAPRQAAGFANETTVREALATFDAHDITIDKIIIDDKWQQTYGENLPNRKKWPDLATFTAEQHALGRHVMLWLKLFDSEGLPPELCIRDATGRPIATDPTNPKYIDLVREEVHQLLAPNHYDADGIKLDFLAQLPYGPGLRWHGRERGFAALHTLLKNIYDAAKATKPTSLIQAQVVSPWFGDTCDQVRENDINDRRPVIDQMTYRAMLASTLLPHHLIDPDGWPMPDIKTLVGYTRAQSHLTGTTTTHFSKTLHGQPLPPRYYKVLREASGSDHRA